MSLSEARQSEHDKYALIYDKVARYGTNPKRIGEAADNLKALPTRGSYLDVGCGRGNMLRSAEQLGFALVRGTEVVPDLIDGKRVVYAAVHDLPFDDNSFDVVSMFDVLEHLLPGDDELACKELARVARRHVLVTANNRPADLVVHEYRYKLHINLRPYEDWDWLFREWFDGDVEWVSKGQSFNSEMWRIDLAV